jgi:hypothetical protein
MQNRPNRCAFAMTDFSAAQSLRHSAAAIATYGLILTCFAQKCSTWNIHSGNVFAGMFHVEHY